MQLANQEDTLHVPLATVLLPSPLLLPSLHTLPSSSPSLSLPHTQLAPTTSSRNNGSSISLSPSTIESLQRSPRSFRRVCCLPITPWGRRRKSIAMCSSKNKRSGASHAYHLAFMGHLLGWKHGGVRMTAMFCFNLSLRIFEVAGESMTREITPQCRAS